MKTARRQARELALQALYAWQISGGDPMIFLQRPISLGLLIAALLLLLIVALPTIRSKREEVFQEQET